MADNKPAAESRKPAKKLYYNHTEVDQVFYINGRAVTVMPKATVELTEEEGRRFRLYLTEGPPPGITRPEKKKGK